MNYLIKIGSQHYLLPNDKGISTIMTAFAGAVCVYDNRWRDNSLEIIDECQVEVSPVSPTVKITTGESTKPSSTVAKFTKVKAVKALHGGLPLLTDS